MIADPCAARVAADLAEPDLLAGIADGRWRIVADAFPRLDFAIAATEPDGTASEYCFRADLENYPAQAPLVRIFDHAEGCVLAQPSRPKGGQRVQISFQSWQSDTVYRPWERMTGMHNGNAATFPHLAWRPERRLAFIFEDLHGLLNSNARASRLRVPA